jgi:hypothetical protein
MLVGAAETRNTWGPWKSDHKAVAINGKQVATTKIVNITEPHR